MPAAALSGGTPTARDEACEPRLAWAGRRRHATGAARRQP
ncbi:hypothetical protein MYA_5990 [Burkholderia sp. KJ006]|nr:hypothetical protein MYA_5990 [Burkholderia sp. KJ006]